MKNIRSYQEDLINSNIFKQVKTMLIINLLTLTHGVVGYLFLADVMTLSKEHGHSEYKLLIYVSIFMLAYFGAVTYLVKEELRVRLYRIGIIIGVQLYLIWSAQTMYYSMIEKRETNIIVWLITMTVVVAFFYFTAIEYMVLYIVNVGTLIIMMTVVEHISIGISALVNIITFTVILAATYYIKYAETLSAYANEQAYIQANETRKLFSASMNHELRSPLNSIIGNTQILLMDSNIPDNERELLENIFGSSKNMVQLVNDLLDFSRLEAGEFTINLVDFNLLELRTNLHAMFANTAKEKNLEYEITMEEGMLLEIHADFTRIQQIIVNIVSNAIKYTREGKVSINMYFRDDNLIVVVKDTGVGMPKETIDDLYTPFKRIEEGKNTNIQGTGLGMFVVKNLLSQMNGTIQCVSEVGLGTTFTVMIPVQANYEGAKYVKRIHLEQPEEKTKVNTNQRIQNVQGEKKSLSGTNPVNGEYDFSGKTILSVDDTVMNNRIIQNLLANTGAKIYCMLDAERCYKYLENSIPDIILLDHMMPGINGVECLETIRKGDNRIKDIPVIMLTGNDGEKYQKLYQDAGANGYLVKPIMQEKLLNTIKNIFQTSN